MNVVIAEPISKKLHDLVTEHDPSWKVYDSSPANKKELIERLKDAQAASSYSVIYDAEIFEACPNLKYLAIPAVGANFFVDMQAAAKHGVTVMNCPGYNSTAVAEMAIALALAVIRKIPAQQKELLQDLWNESSRGFLISGKQVGLIGNGNVSKAIRQLLSGWSVKQNYVDSRSSSSEVDVLIRQSDVVFVCCPLSDDTKGLVSSVRIKSMKKTAILVNIGRGAVVDQEALYSALKAKNIFGAGLDVFADEPEYGSALSSDIKKFVELDNVLVTPHVAGGSVESNDTLGQMIYENLKSAAIGKPVHIYK